VYPLLNLIAGREGGGCASWLQMQDPAGGSRVEVLVRGSSVDPGVEDLKALG
jgi:hypothetical protein